ncbi:hypothetical protein, partial [Bacteroides clarus]|uniref:hypothetical protein n=1 Tax=Bacteroides clarus TaxID=626929 RepID=UPI0021767CCF
MISSLVSKNTSAEKSIALVKGGVSGTNNNELELSKFGVASLLLSLVLSSTYKCNFLGADN